METACGLSVTRHGARSDSRTTKQQSVVWPEKPVDAADADALYLELNFRSATDAAVSCTSTAIYKTLTTSKLIIPNF